MTGGSRSLGPPGSAASPEDLQLAVRARLYERRTVVVWGRLDDLVVGDVAAELMTLDALGDEPIELAISSPGGTLDAALALVDVIDLLGVPVHATCLGQLEGPPVAALAVCARRVAAPHARFRLVEEPVELAGAPVDLESFVRDHRARLGALARRIAEATGRHSPDEVAADFAAGRFLSAEEAVRYGLVDEVGRPDARLLRLPRAGGAPGFGFRTRA